MYSLAELLQRAFRRLDFAPGASSIFRRAMWQLRGADIGRGTHLPRAEVTWPHQVRIGRNCILQPDIFFNYDHYWTPGPSIVVGNRVFIGRGVEFNIQGRIEIGDDALIAAGCVFVDHDHGLDPDCVINRQAIRVMPISVGRGVWLGANVVVLKGVRIEEGAVVGAGSIVTKCIPAGEIWAGNPAHFLRRRSADATAAENCQVNV